MNDRFEWTDDGNLQVTDGETGEVYVLTATEVVGLLISLLSPRKGAKP